MAASPDSHDSYVHGQMDISQHEKTFRAFMSACKWVSLHLLVLAFFFTLWFCVDGVGLLWSALIAIVTAVLGFFFIRFFFPAPGEGGH